MEHDARPEWADPRTIEWCAQRCRELAGRIAALERQHGANACTWLLRWYASENYPGPPKASNG